MHGMHSRRARVSFLNTNLGLFSANGLIIVLPGPTLAISDAELKRIGKNSTADATVRIPPEHGGGYYATLEVFHQLHCLVSPTFISEDTSLVSNSALSRTWCVWLLTRSIMTLPMHLVTTKNG